MSARGVDEIRAVVDNSSGDLKGKFRSRLSILANLPEREWNENFIKSLSGDCKGLSEIRFTANKIQQRPLGYKSGNNEFTILFWAQEKSGRWVPPTACTQALNRKAEVEKDGKRACDLWFKIL